MQFPYTTMGRCIRRWDNIMLLCCSPSLGSLFAGSTADLCAFWRQPWTLRRGSILGFLRSTHVTHSNYYLHQHRLNSPFHNPETFGFFGFFGFTEYRRDRVSIQAAMMPYFHFFNCLFVFEISAFSFSTSKNSTSILRACSSHPFGECV